MRKRSPPPGFVRGCEWRTLSPSEAVGLMENLAVGDTTSTHGNSPITVGRKRGAGAEMGRKGRKRAAGAETGRIAFEPTPELKTCVQLEIRQNHHRKALTRTLHLDLLDNSQKYSYDINI